MFRRHHRGPGLSCVSRISFLRFRLKTTVRSNHKRNLGASGWSLIFVNLTTPAVEKPLSLRPGFMSYSFGVKRVLSQDAGVLSSTDNTSFALNHASSPLKYCLLYTSDAADERSS